jgi:hypothetical protein
VRRIDDKGHSCEDGGGRGWVDPSKHLMPGLYTKLRAERSLPAFRPASIEDTRCERGFRGSVATGHAS